MTDLQHRPLSGFGTVEGFDAVITTAATVTGAIRYSPGLASLTVMADFVFGSGAAVTAKAYFQTSLDRGLTWIDIAAFAFTTTSATKISALSKFTALAAAAAPTDGTLTDDTILDGLLGDRFRVKVISTGTYGGSTTLKVWLVFKP